MPNKAKMSLKFGIEFRGDEEIALFEAVRKKLDGQRLRWKEFMLKVFEDYLEKKS